MTVGEPGLAQRSSGGGCLLSLALVVVVAVAAIPIADHWSTRGGEEWWTALVLGSAGAATLRGLIALVSRRTRSWGAGLIAGALLGLAIVFGLPVLLRRPPRLLAHGGQHGSRTKRPIMPQVMPR